MWFPWNVDDIESTAAFNLQQTLINFVPLVLTGLAVGFAFRCGMFNIGGQGQYLGGAIMAVWIGSELPGLPGVVHVLFAVIARRARRRDLGRDRRLPQGDGRDARGDLDDHAQLDRDLDRRLPVRARRPAPERHAALRPRLERRRRGGEAADLLGRPVPAGAPRRLLRRARRPRRLLDHAQPDDARLRGAGGRLQPRGRPLRRHLGRAQLLPRDGDLGRVRRARRRDRHRRLGLPDQHERRA